MVEVATGQLSRPAVIGGSIAKIDADLIRTVIEKVRQIESTIGQLRGNEAALTHRPAVPGRRFLPLLVSTEGLPLDPFINDRIRELLRDNGLLTASDVGRLHIIDQEELDLVEACTAAGVGGLRDLLEQHERSALATMSFKNWLIVEKRVRVERAARLDAPFERAWKPAVEALEEAAAARAAASDTVPKEGA